MKFRPKDLQEYKRISRNARRKVERIKKQYGIDVTGEVNLPLNIPFQVDTRSNGEFSSRKDFNEWKEQMESFLNRNNQKFQFVKNKHGIVMTKSMETRADLLEKRQNRIAKEERLKWVGKPFYSGGERQDVTAGERNNQYKQTGYFDAPDSLGVNNVRGLHFSDIKNYKSLQRAFARLNRKANQKDYDLAKERMKENWIRSVEGSFNSEADDIVEMVKRLTPDEFYELYMMVDEMEFAKYDSEGQRVDADEGMLEEIRSMISQYLGGELDLPLKGI